MGLVQVIPQAVALTKALLDSILLKGDGVLYMGDDAPALMGFPPEHALNPDPNTPDHPMWAHNPNTGDLLEGGLHPIDGLATNLDGWLKSKGVGANPMDFINRAIKMFNDRHNMKEHHQLPLFDSPEWRKLTVGGYPGREESSDIPVRGHDGKLITHWANRGGAVGLFPETGAVPFYKELRELVHGMFPQLDDKQLQELTQERNYLHNPHIEPHHGLAENVRRTKKNEIAAHGGIIPSHLIDRFGPEGALAEMQYGGLHTWQVAHHLPDLMYAPIAQNPRSRRNPKTHEMDAPKTISDAEQSISRALSMLSPDQLPSEPIRIQGPDGSFQTVPFNQAISDPQMRTALLHDMHKSPALQFMFGHGLRGPSHWDKGWRKHLQPLLAGEEHDRTAAQTHMRAGTPVKGTGLHNSAVHIGSLVTAMGQPSAEDPTRSALVDHKFGHEAEGNTEEIERRRGILETLADTVARGHGDEPRWYPRHPETGEPWAGAPESPLYSRQVSGYGKGPYSQTPPSHFQGRFYTDLNTPMTGRKLIPEGRVPQPEEGREPPVPEISTQPLLSTPPLPQSAARPEPAAFTPQTPAEVAVRERVGQLNPADLRGVMEAGGRYGASGRPGEGQLTPMERRYQQTMGDPAQTRLSQFLRSDDSFQTFDKVEKAMETLQLYDAQQDELVQKHLPTRQDLSLDVEGDVKLMASHLGLTPHDIRSLAISKGDWHRVAEVFKVPPPVVGAVKVVFS